jgi:hypothetical protein
MQKRTKATSGPGRRLATFLVKTAITPKRSDANTSSAEAGAMGWLLAGPSSVKTAFGLGIGC